jgi:hypothetical protein
MMQVALGTCTRVLRTGEPGYVGRPARLSLSLRPMAHREPLGMQWQHRSPPGREVGSRAAGHVTTSEPSLSERWDPDPLETWRRRSPPYQGGRDWGHWICDDAGALLIREVGSGVTGHVMTPEPSLSGRRGLEPLDMW